MGWVWSPRGYSHSFPATGARIARTAGDRIRDATASEEGNDYLRETTHSPGPALRSLDDSNAFYEARKRDV